MTRLDELITTEQAAAIETLRSTLGVDPAADPKFWECLLAQILSGVTTAASAAHDIDLAGIGVEVKFSREFSMVLGDNRRSNVFRWTALSGHGDTPKDASSTILVGAGSVPVRVVLGHPGRGALRDTHRYVRCAL
ncbi:hypothetical protein P5V33_15835 [Mycobacteroides abscessus subsp. abscessus]|nr:hypothetical protein [Mycobacteroides abscessus subsp. abscessus]